MKMGKWLRLGALVAAIAIAKQYGGKLGLGLGLDKDAALALFQQWSDRLGIWAIPLYVALHTLTLSLCLPYAVFFEAGASLLFGFFPAVLSVFSAKILGASLSFWFGRLVFRSSSSAMDWVQRNKYFHLISRGVERDGWRFVLLARFSPIPSYVINYALAATQVGFVVDFLLPTVVGCLPMILQNTSIGSLAGAAVASTSRSKKSMVWSFILPLLGTVSSILISLKVKQYSTDITLAESYSGDHINSCNNFDSSQTSNGREGSNDLRKSH
ncbi:SNARE associated Golgi protein family [Corchorus capsularis]|uniref:SNARE associated Golgi protein family n=1 Tax=Corchorus capsularis TaxID=210143 RepID=A0A1R3JY60_COCAP|nr:SNARE associated Golgi protein family [Corchorus capsularis]